jgi:hypothetical protein
MTRTISRFYRSCSQAYSMILRVPRTALAFFWRSLIWRSLIWRTVSGLPGSHGQYIDFVPRSYEEDEIWEKGMEPRCRSLRLVYHALYLIWHVKVTFRGTLQSAQTSTFAAKQVRREQLKISLKPSKNDPLRNQQNRRSSSSGEMLLSDWTIALPSRPELNLRFIRLTLAETAAFVRFAEGAVSPNPSFSW